MIMVPVPGRSRGLSEIQCITGLLFRRVMIMVPVPGRSRDRQRYNVLLGYFSVG